jgi:hypothetical protein
MTQGEIMMSRRECRYLRRGYGCSLLAEQGLLHRGDFTGAMGSHWQHGDTIRVFKYQEVLNYKILPYGVVSYLVLLQGINRWSKEMKMDSRKLPILRHA